MIYTISFFMNDLLLLPERNGTVCSFDQIMKHNPVKPKQRIQETVTWLFHSQGYNNTGVNQIVAEAGVVKSVLYQHFHSKEDMAIAFLNSRHVLWFEKLKTSISFSLNIEDKVIAAFDFIKQINSDEEFRGCAFLNMLPQITSDNTRILETIRRHKEDLRNFFHELLKQSKIDPDLIYLLFESAIIESKLFKNNWPVESAKAIINSLIN
jgi:AcrR family transcriptional regulator